MQKGMSRPADFVHSLKYRLQILNSSKLILINYYLFKYINIMAESGCLGSAAFQNLSTNTHGGSTGSAEDTTFTSSGDTTRVTVNGDDVTTNEILEITSDTLVDGTSLLVDSTSDNLTTGQLLKVNHTASLGSGNTSGPMVHLLSANNSTDDNYRLLNIINTHQDPSSGAILNIEGVENEDALHIEKGNINFGGSNKNILFKTQQAVAGSNGSELTINTQKGGDNNAGAGGIGGTLELKTEAGGDTRGQLAGGTGGSLNINAGDGGVATAGTDGGVGGKVTIKSGTGGASTSQTGGSGGEMVIQSGEAGPAGAGSAGDDGKISIGSGSQVVTTIASIGGVSQNLCAIEIGDSGGITCLIYTGTTIDAGTDISNSDGTTSLNWDDKGKTYKSLFTFTNSQTRKVVIANPNSDGSDIGKKIKILQTGVPTADGELRIGFAGVGVAPYLDNTSIARIQDQDFLSDGIIGATGDKFLKIVGNADALFGGGSLVILEVISNTLIKCDVDARPTESPAIGVGHITYESSDITA